VSDPIADVVVGIVTQLVEGGIHLLDPAEREKSIREAVASQAAVWASLDARTSTQRADETTARHTVERRPGAPAADGRAAFEAYRAHRGGVNHDGTPTPTWEDLGEPVRAGWNAAAAAVAARVAP